jgi:hypothetical protein
MRHGTTPIAEPAPAPPASSGSTVGSHGLVPAAVTGSDRSPVTTFA